MTVRETILPERPKIIARAQRRVLKATVLMLQLAAYFGSCPTRADDHMPLAAPDFRNQAKLDNSQTSQTVSNLPPLQGRVGSFEILIDELQRRFGFRCKENDRGLAVESASMDSVAFKAGLRDGDLITDATKKGNAFELSIERNGKRSLVMLTPKADESSDKFQMRIQRPAFPLQAEKQQPNYSRPQMPNFDFAKNLTFNASVTKTAKLLANYNLELIVDRSMSMRKRDCPGGSSRWGWCGQQAEELGNQLSAINNQSISITTFAGNYLVYENQSPTQISNVFASSQLEWGTRLGEPLEERINRALQTSRQNGKPALIAIITDGVPSPRYEPQLVVDVLVEATRKLRKPQELKVLFLQVGSQDPRGQFYLQNLDSRLMDVGARYDIVQTITFDHLEQVGLGQALASCVSAVNSPTLRQSTRNNFH